MSPGFFYGFNLKLNKMAKTTEKTTTDELIYSPVEDNGKNIANSPIWKNAWHRDEITPEAVNKFHNWWEYAIRFDGLKPQQLLKVKKVLL